MTMLALLLHGARLTIPALVFAACLALPTTTVLAQSGTGGSVVPADARTGGSTGLPVPRFVSLKSNKVNVRSGPGTQYPIQWVFQRAGLPVEVIKEFENWRQIRDSEAATGWVAGALLSGRRTALVMPWSLKDTQPGNRPTIEVHEQRNTNTRVTAIVEAGAVVDIANCDGTRCRITVSGADARGWIDQKSLWGIYENETLP